MKQIRKLLLIFTLIISVLLTGCGSGTKDSSNNKETIVVGTNAEFAPFEYINDNGEVDGFDIALIKAIGDEMGFNVSITNMEFKSITAAIKNGSVDCSISGMTITEERKQAVDFSDSYYTASQSIIVLKDSDISSLDDLNGKKIATQEGTTGDLMATVSDDNEYITDPNTVDKRFKKGSDAILELKNGGVDAVLIDTSPARNFVNKNKNTLKLIEDVGAETEEYGIAVSKGNSQLLDKINEGLQIVKDNGTYDKLVDEYINGNMTEATDDSGNILTNFINRVKSVFITTNGYKLLLKGLWTTIYISISAVFIGVVLGFIVALMKMTETNKGHKTILSRIAGAYISVLRGTPVVVQLLIMYMVVFKSHYGIIAAILTFGINSGAYVAENVRAGIMAVDKGQTEGGLSLGFTNWQTMKFIVLPQAIKNIIPALGNEFIALVKETSIVGYVAIQDLTKAADFIISRTYETFLPLIAIAIIYFVLILCLTKLLGMVERRLRQSDIR